MKKQEKSKLKEIEKVVTILKDGGVVIFPTDTVYGVGCRFDNQDAVNRLYKIKGAPQAQFFPILVSKITQVKRLAKVNNSAEKLMREYWPGGLTVILIKSSDLKPGLKQLRKPGLRHNKIGFRMPDSDLVRSIIDKVGVPIIGTSANFHGKSVPRSFEELNPEFVKLADFVIKGKCQGGIESTVVDTTVDPPAIIRQGAVIVNDPKN